VRSGVRVCDLGCAEGIALMLMAESFPNSEFVGIDVSGDVIQKATA
jgi:tRNA G46 methylase TrmB